MKPLVALWRLLRVLAHALGGLCTITLEFPRLNPSQQQAKVQQWARGMLGVLGITLEVRGEPGAQGPLLLVSNHISWLDILVLHAGRYCRFVSKADVHHWPLVGRLATGAGTLYIERDSRRDAMRVVHHMAQALRAGDVLAVFPEGTTSDGVELLPFHGNLLQAAIAVDAPVQPVALSFIETASRQSTLRPCYIGNDTLVGSMWRMLTGPGITAVVSYGRLERHADRDRRAWAADLREQVRALRQS